MTQNKKAHGLADLTADPTGAILNNCFKSSLLLLYKLISPALVILNLVDCAAAYVVSDTAIFLF